MTNDMYLNKVMIIGNVANDIEIKKISNSDTSVVALTVATNRKYKNRDGQMVEETEYHKCVAYGPLADLVGRFVSKGRKVYLEGRLRTRSWEDTTGQKKYATEIIADNIIFLDKREHTGGESHEPQELAHVDDLPF